MPHILVVDDYAAIRLLIQKVLEAAGYQVTTARDGEEARALLVVMVPDLLLLDFNLPRQPGRELVQHIHATTTIPILLMRGWSRHEPAIQAVMAQTCGYLEKPFTLEALMLLVDTCLLRVGTA